MLQYRFYTLRNIIYQIPKLIRSINCENWTYYSKNKCYINYLSASKLLKKSFHNRTKIIIFPVLRRNFSFLSSFSIPPLIVVSRLSLYKYLIIFQSRSCDFRNLPSSFFQNYYLIVAFIIVLILVATIITANIFGVFCKFPSQASFSFEIKSRKKYHQKYIFRAFSPRLLLYSRKPLFCPLGYVCPHSGYHTVICLIHILNKILSLSNFYSFLILF